MLMNKGPGAVVNTVIFYILHVLGVMNLLEDESVLETVFLLPIITVYLYSNEVSPIITLCN